MSVTVNFTISPSAVEEIPASAMPAIGAMVATYAAFNTRLRLNASSSPPVTKVFAEQLTGVQSLDLTALTRTLGGSIDATGLKLQGLHLINESSTAAVSIADGATNPYPILGGESLVVPAGGQAALLFNDKLADVASTVKNLAITAGASQTYLLMLLFG